MKKLNPSGLTEVINGVPTLHRPAVGNAEVACPWDVPQTAFTGVVDLVALQEAVAPPLVPRHCQDQGPVPETALAVPELQRFALGAEGKEPPFADPQVPAVAVQPHGCVVTGFGYPQKLSATTFPLLSLHTTVRSCICCPEGCHEHPAFDVQLFDDVNSEQDSVL